MSRRSVLMAAGAGLTGAGLTPTGAFDAVDANRGTSVTLAGGPNAVIGVDVYSPVQKNSQDPLVDLTNNLDEDATVTVSLNVPQNGTTPCDVGDLHDPQGDVGCTVTFPLNAGNSNRVDITPSVSGVDVYFSIDVSSPTFSLSTTGSTFAEAGNTKGAVNFKKLQGFDAVPNQDEWDLKSVKIQDGDGDADLDRVEYEITDSSGNTVATRTDACGCNGGARYDVKNITIQPDDPNYDVPNTNETYTLTVVGYDVDGNFDQDTAEVVL